MLFNPVSLVPEARHLVESGVPDPYKLLTVDVGANLTTPFHVAANRLRELSRCDKRHGSCGMGIGETVAYAIACGEGRWGTGAAYPYTAEVPFAYDLMTPATLREKCALLCKRLKGDLAPLYDPARPEMQAEWDVLDDFDGTMDLFESYAGRVAKHIEIVPHEWFDAELVKDQTIVFEGAQGVLLDENHGFHPHTTWSTTTFESAPKLVRVKRENVKRIGVLRGYMTRHGAGPFVTEDTSIPIPEGEHNGTGKWQESFRMGHFDAVMLRYALDVLRQSDVMGRGVDELALTCLDHLTGPVKMAWEYEPKSLAGKRDDTPRFEILPVHQPPMDLNLSPELDAHLHKQQELGHLLRHALSPVYRELPNVEAFVSEVEKTAETPVKILSYGPRASDKRSR
jgi:adenylosuccinate synthase